MTRYWLTETDAEATAMMKALYRLTYDASSEIIGIMIGAPAGVLSAVYQRIFRGS